MEFIEWIIKEKGYSDRSARDVVSRVKRANKICGKESFTLKELEQNKEFENLSVSVKSQIRCAVRIRDNYQKKMNE
jgi:hypothetical protein